MFQAVYEFKEVERPRPVFTSEFYPDLDDRKANKLMPKNYITKQNHGSNRKVKPVWIDPNPFKYGGQYGMQALKEKFSETFQNSKKD